MRQIILVILLGLATVHFGCGPETPRCPRDIPAPDLEANVGDVYTISSYSLRDRDAQPAHPYLHQATEREIEVLSESSISVTYLREDGAVVVETYEVTGLELRPR
jgi:hypothetical protein